MVDWSEVANRDLKQRSRKGRNVSGNMVRNDAQKPGDSVKYMSQLSLYSKAELRQFCRVKLKDENRNWGHLLDVQDCLLNEKYGS